MALGPTNRLVGEVVIPPWSTLHRRSLSPAPVPRLWEDLHRPCGCEVNLSELEGDWRVVREGYLFSWPLMFRLIQYVNDARQSWMNNHDTDVLAQNRHYVLGMRKNILHYLPRSAAAHLRVNHKSRRVRRCRRQFIDAIGIALNQAMGPGVAPRVTCTVFPEAVRALLTLAERNDF